MCGDICMILVHYCLVWRIPGFVVLTLLLESQDVHLVMLGNCRIYPILASTVT